MSKDDGGPAFPVDEDFDHIRKEIIKYADPGMSLRDYFAAKALASLICEPSRGGSNSLAWALGPKMMDTTLNYATVAYKFADAMLEARK